MHLLPEEVDSPVAAAKAEGIPYEQAMSRSARESRLARTGGWMWWKLRLELSPEAVEAAWPVVLDADESRVIDGAWLDGRPVAGFDGDDPTSRVMTGEGITPLPGFDTRDRGGLWSSGEGSLLLPLDGRRPSGELVLKVQHLPHLYANGFGRLRLRPATLDEVLRLVKKEKGVGVLNRANIPLRVEVVAVHQDYFGVVLKEEKRELALAPGELAEMDISRPHDPALYQTRYVARAAGRATREYWHLHQTGREERQRTEVMGLEQGWEWVFVPGPHDQHPAPAAGWKSAKLPHEVPRDAYTSHWMWYRLRFEVPNHWTGERLQLHLPGFVSLHARIYLDGKPAGEYPNWELPRKIMLPVECRPGQKHELLIGVTDYIVALAEGIKPPVGGPMSAPARSLVAPVSSTHEIGIGLKCVPELIAVPAVRTERAKVETRLAGPGRVGQLSVAATLVHDGGAEGEYLLEARVLERGREVMRLDDRKVRLTPGGEGRADWTVDWKNPRLWNLEDPWLYELRIELKDASGTRLDVHRERFGFREVGVRGNHFTLNGKRVNLLGGSHVVIQSLIWPVRHHPYAILRHFGNIGHNGFLKGRDVLHLADEMGFLVKNENAHLNSHHMDNYAWHQPAIWEKLLLQMKALEQSQGNHPSNIMWDIGNEIIFRGSGEAERMGRLMGEIRAFDPTRLVTVGGSAPFPEGAEVLDVHGWGGWKNRSDYHLYNPEERPSYLQKSGIYAHRPAKDPEKDWAVDRKIQSGISLARPNDQNKLHHWEGKPVLFSEGHYYESQIPIELLGHDAYLRLERGGAHGGLDRYQAMHGLNMLATRTITIQNVRDAGFPSAMIHVDRGIGRAALPLAGIPHDRRARFASGARMQSLHKVAYDLSQPGRVTARYRLLDGEAEVGEKTLSWRAEPGSQKMIELDFPLPRVKEDRELRLEVRIHAGNTGRGFHDDIPVVVFAEEKTALSSETVLQVFDPAGNLARHFRDRKVAFEPVARLSDWAPEKGRVLWAGPESLNRADESERAGLGAKLAAGGRMVVLDHRNMPRFLDRPLVQKPGILNTVARLDAPSVLTRGLVPEDFRFWTTRERDQMVSWGPMELPSTGRFRAHLTTGTGSPLLELEEGKGRVVFAQLNFQDALGLDPAADRLLSNLIDWCTQPSPFPDVPSLLVAGDPAFVATMKNRLGWDGGVEAQPAGETLRAARLIVVSAGDSAARAVLASRKQEVRAALEAGATLVVYGAAPEQQDWLGQLAGRPVRIEAAAGRAALLTGHDPLTAGLGHGDFFPEGANDSRPVETVLPPEDSSLGWFRVSGEGVQSLSRPAFLAGIPVGRGRVVVFNVRSVEQPLPALTRILSTVLANAGAPLVAGGSRTEDTTTWSFTPLDISASVNWPLMDQDQPGARRGWHLGGSDNDMREFPSGRQTFRGVDYLLPDPSRHGGNGVIGLSSAKPKIPELPREVKGIPVNRKADRLYFLHNSAWGIPEFVYRVYYLEDRKKWIPGQPDPFVDVVVKPKENIHDWWFGGDIDSGKMFLPGATVAWLGDNPSARSRGNKVGVYQMSWDNPHPGKTIESIDILATGRPGEGNAYVFAVTAATRADGVAPEKPPLEKILPKGLKVGAVYEQVQFGRYGFVLMKDGSIGSVYDREGRILASSRGWGVQASKARPGQPPEQKSLGTQQEQTPAITGRQEGSKRTFLIEGQPGTGPLDWRMRLVATPGALRAELEFTPRTAPPDAETGVNVLFGLQFGGGCKADNSKPNENPLRVATPAGLATVAFDERYRSWFRSYAVYPESVTFYAPPHNAPDYAVGQEERLWWELGIP